MATYDTSTGLRALTGGSLISEIDDGFLALAQDVAARLPTYVTSLPAVPYDGQEVYFLAGTSTIWHFRYRAAGSTYKWEFVGGPDLTNSDSLSFSTSSTTYVPALSLTIPNLKGSFRVRFGGAMQQASSGTGYMSASSGVTNPLDSLAAYMTVGTTSPSPRASNSYETSVVCTTAGDTIRIQHRVSSGTLDVVNRWMSVTPLAVGL